MKESEDRGPSPACGGPSGCCGPGTSRRQFLAHSGLAVAALVKASGLRPWNAIAGPFQRGSPEDFPIPADKKLAPAWVRSLYERGAPAVYRKSADQLRFLGMPVGGIGAGQLYLGGDGRLWHFDLFNLPAPEGFNDSSGPHYASPPAPRSPLEQGFALRVTQDGRSATRRLDASGFAAVEFRGQYPIGRVDYRDPESPVAVDLEAFSPFVPLEADDSSLPATILRYSLTNTSAAEVEVEIAGWVENPVCLGSGRPGLLRLRNRRLRTGPADVLECSALPPEPGSSNPSPRPDLVFEDFEKPDYAGWTVSGTAFGSGPMEKSRMPGYQGDVNAEGQRLVNTHQTRNGEDVVQADTHLGHLTSKEFVIQRRYLCFRIGGGNHPGKTGLNLRVGGEVVRTATGRDSNRMRLESFDVADLEGRTAQLEIVDEEAGSWGNVGVDDLVFSDRPRYEPFVLEQQADFGTLALASLGEAAIDPGVAPEALPDAAFSLQDRAEVQGPFGKPLLGSVVQRQRLLPGATWTATFVLAWHFDGLWWDSLGYLTGGTSLRRHYGTKFRSAVEVVQYVAGHLESLSSTTRLWRDTWYDSTLPFWFLDRTLANASTLATATCYRLSDGRFYGWEGNYCCAGTCTHVWQYAHSVARLFPALERDTRERVDFGLAFHDDTGAIDYRAEAARELAIDGQAGTILRAYREHTMSADAEFLRRIWPRVKKALELLLSRDADADGILDGAQYNTLDATWYGAISWTTSLYLAALRAGVAMATERDDPAFAERCRSVADRGSRSLVERLFNGEYFIHEVDPEHPEANSTGDGCHIDQLLGQSWAHQVGLPRIVPLEASRSALHSLYRYNFAPDVGPYREAIEKRIDGGRWYAMPGEGGLLMCTWPRGGSDAATGEGEEAWAAGYFNECMSGFEYQVAAHAIWEGLVEEGLAITRMIHDRYDAARRNPWNEVECADHYARAMASHGVFLAACGFEYHGPAGHLGFAPRLTPESFRAAFTAAEGWGTLEQTRSGDRQEQVIALRHGTLRLRTLAFDTGSVPARAVGARAGDRALDLEFRAAGARLEIQLAQELTLAAGERLEVSIERPV